MESLQLEEQECKSFFHHRLDQVPPTIHSRSGIFLGSAAEVDKIEALYKKLDDGQL